MHNNYKQTQELMDNIIKELNVYMDLIGPRNEQKQDTYGFVPGLEMEREAKNIDYHIHKLREGIFQVLFTGAFTSGKSTLLNALMKKKILSASINPETAVITKIIFNADELVKIIYKKCDESGERLTEELSVKEFFDTYKVSQDNPDAFMDVDYVVLQQPQDGIGGKLVQLVDSPGTNNSRADDETAQEFAKKASAIVFLINATASFIYGEKEYIKEHFANKHMKNLFFVINHIDGVNADQIASLKKNVRAQLTNVFTKEDGSFDEALFNSRVFYTNAYGSLMSRLNKKIETPYGQTEVDDALTGVPQFEEALGKYLTDENRDKDALAAYLSQMANIYISAEENVVNNLNQLRAGVEKAREDKADLERCIKKTESILEGIKISCSTAVRNIIMAAKNEYISMVNRIDSNWESYFEEENFEGFSTKDIIAITSGNLFQKNNPEKMEECKQRLAPITNAITTYCTSETNIMTKNMESHISGYINLLEKELTNYKQQLEAMDCPVDIKNIFDKFNRELSVGNNDNIEIKSNVFQMALGILGGDPDSLIDGASGQKSNKEFLIQFISKNIIEYIAINVVAWPFGIAILIGRLISIIKNLKSAGSSTARNMANGVHNDTVNNLKDSQEKFIVELEKNIEGPILLAGNSFANTFEDELKASLRSLDNVISQLESDSSAEANEKQRTDELLGNMVNCFNRVSVLTGGREYTSQEITEFASKK